MKCGVPHTSARQREADQLGNDTVAKYQEEISCDEFATTFLLGWVEVKGATRGRLLLRGSALLAIQRCLTTERGASIRPATQKKKPRRAAGAK